MKFTIYVKQQKIRLISIYWNVFDTANTRVKFEKKLFRVNKEKQAICMCSNRWFLLARRQAYDRESQAYGRGIQTDGRERWAYGRKRQGYVQWGFVLAERVRHVWSEGSLRSCWMEIDAPGREKKCLHHDISIELRDACIKIVYRKREKLPASR